MKSESEKHRLWFETVVQPKLQTLLDLSQAVIDLNSFDYKPFFKEFLADLELLALDNYPTENQVEKICAALEVLQKRSFEDSQFALRDVALVASLQSSLDRALFFGKWRTYQRFMKMYGPVEDEALVDAFRISVLLKMLVVDISQRASALIAGAPEIVHEEAS